MHRLFPYFVFLINLNPAFGQVKDSLYKNHQSFGLNSALRTVDSLNRIINSLFPRQTNPPLDSKTLEGNLVLTLSKSSESDGRWVYSPETANIQKIEKPEISKVIPEYAFYKVRLTNYLGYHVNSSTNLILFDSIKSKLIHVIPMWYSDRSEDFLKLFIGQHFSDSSSLLAFTLELQDLMNIGSTGNFENTIYNEDKVTFDLTYQGANKKEVWRHFEMFITDNTIRRFRSTNPQMETSTTIQ